MILKAAMSLAMALAPLTVAAQPSADVALDGPSFDSEAVPDETLAEQRGGIRLPSGIDVALGVETHTAVNGAVVLQTVMKLDEGAPTVTVYAPEDGETVAARPNAGQQGVSPAPTVVYDRQGGVRISRSGLGPNVSITSSPSAAGSQDTSGLIEIDMANPVTTQDGVIARVGEAARSGVELKSSDLHVVHYTAGAFGSAIANSANDRVIDTQTTISIDLRNAGPDVLGSTMFRVENVAIDAMSTRM